MFNRPVRSKVVNNSITIGPRGRGVARGSPLIRPVNDCGEHSEPQPRITQSEPRMQFLPMNRGRAKRLDRPCPNQSFYVNKSVNEDELRELTEQMAAAELRANRNTSNKSKYLEDTCMCV